LDPQKVTRNEEDATQPSELDTISSGKVTAQYDVLEVNNFGKRTSTSG
jgi:hypothetical protein